MNVEDVIQILKEIGCSPEKNGDGFKSFCPAHEGSGDNLNMTVKEGDDGRVLLHCFGGCTFDAIVDALKIDKKELFANDSRSFSLHPPITKTPTPKRDKKRAEFDSCEAATSWMARKLTAQRIGGEWSYTDADGKLVFKVARFNLKDGDKTFKPFHPVAGKWRIEDPPAPLPLFHLPEVITAQRVFVFEGEKCADLARAHLGIVATTAAHGASSPKKTNWAPLVGKEIFFVPDHDKAGDGYVDVAAGILAGLDPRTVVKVVRLPVTNPGDDLVEWVGAGGGPDQFAELVAAAPKWVAPLPSAGGSAQASPAGQANEGADDPHRLARLHLAKYQHGGLPTLRFYRGEWLEWSDGAYRPITESELRSGLARTAKDEFDRLNGLAVDIWNRNGGNDSGGKPIDKPVARKVTRNLVSDTMQALQSLSILAGKIESPSWIDGPGPFEPRETVPTLTALVSLTKIADLLTLHRRDGKQVDTSGAIAVPNPRFFSTYALNFGFDLDAPVPLEWIKFLASLWVADFESIETLQEYFGYCLAPDTSQQKILGIFGPKRAGKDTIARILTALVGPENTAGPTLASLSGDFGLSPLIGKPLAIVSDARISKRSDAATIVERLLTISGEGRVTIDRKFIEAWTGKLPTRFVMISNEIPQLADSSGALAGRMILLRLTKSFYGKEDTKLFDRLIPELPGILIWAIEGWHRLQERGRFIQPKAGLDLLESLEELSSPMIAFIRERCEVGPVQEIETKLLFEAWVAWCGTIGQKRPGTSQWFARDLRAACPSVSTYRTDRAGKDSRFYKGIDLKVAF